MKRLSKNWRRLRSNEIIRKGDVYFGSDPLNDPPTFHKSFNIGYKPSDNVQGCKYYRRVK